MPLCPPLSLHVLFYSISYRLSPHLQYGTLSPPPSRYNIVRVSQEKEKQQLKELWFEEHVKKWLREEATDEAPAEEEEIVEV